MKYHPDRNPDDQEAADKFKELSEHMKFFQMIKKDKPMITLVTRE